MLMISASLLASHLSRHAKIISDITAIFLISRKGKLSLVSSNKTGTIIVTSVPYDGEEFRACVDGTVLGSVIKKNSNITLSLSESRLHVKSASYKADLPVSVSEFPNVPSAETTTLLSKHAIELIEALIPQMAIKVGGPDTQLSIVCDGDTWHISNYDAYYGAFHSSKAEKGTPKLDIALFPTEAAALVTALAGKKVSISNRDNTLIISKENEKIALPSVASNAVKLSVVDAGSKALASIPIAELQEVISSLSAFAKDDATNITCSLKESSLTINISSTGGTSSHKINAKVKSAEKFVLNFKMARDLIGLCKGKNVLLFGHYAEDSITRIQFRTEEVRYIMVASL